MFTHSPLQNDLASLFELVDCGVCSSEKISPPLLSDNRSFVIIYLTAGSGELSVGHRIHLLEEGTFIICRPFEIKSFILSEDEPFEFFWARFSGRYTSELLSSLSLSSKEKYFIGKNIEVTAQIGALVAETEREASAVLQTSLFTAVLCRMSRIVIDISPSEKGKGYDKILPALNAINSDCTSNAGVEEYAKLCNLSSSYFTHLFTKIIGFSPMEYKQIQRINIAKNLLSTTNLSIKEISTIIGFKDPLYFGRCFKQSVGQTPSGFRANR